MIHGYLLSLQVAARLSESDCRARFPQRFERSKAFRRREDALRCIGAGALLSGILGLAESDIQYGPQGKPYVQNPAIQFSLSHSGSFVMLATGSQAVGADLEKQDDARLIRSCRAFTAEEQAWLAQSPTERFLTLWTMKESFAKLLGCGLNASVFSQSVLPLLTCGRMMYEGMLLHGHSEVYEAHTLSVCSLEEGFCLHTVTLADLGLAG